MLKMYCEKCTLKSNRVQCIRMWYVTKNILVIRDAWKYYNLYSPGPHRPIALKMDIILLRRLVQNFIFMHKNFPPEQLVSETISFRNNKFLNCITSTPQLTRQRWFGCPRKIFLSGSRLEPNKVFPYPSCLF